MFESIQLNIRGGRLPAPEGNGRRAISRFHSTASMAPPGAMKVAAVPHWRQDPLRRWDSEECRTLLSAFRPSRTLVAKQKTVPKGGQREGSEFHQSCVRWRDVTELRVRHLRPILLAYPRRTFRSAQIMAKLRVAGFDGGRGCPRRYCSLADARVVHGSFGRIVCRLEASHPREKYAERDAQRYHLLHIELFSGLASIAMLRENCVANPHGLIALGNISILTAEDQRTSNSARSNVSDRALQQCTQLRACD